MNQPEHDLRKRLEKKLGRKLSERAWKFLRDQRYVEPVIRGEETIDFLLEVARDIPDGVPETDVRRKATRRERRERVVPAYAGAISYAIAWRASQLKEVDRYRSKWLPDGLLKPVQILRWVAQRLKQCRPSEMIVELPLGSRLAWDKRSLKYVVLWETPDSVVPIGKLRIVGPSGIQALHLPYRANSKAAVNGIIAVGKEGPLGELADISKHLSTTLPWDETDSSVFVLTNLPPPISGARFGYRISGQFPAMSRITIEVDPTMTARELYAEYTLFRRGLEKRPRIRSLSEKHSKLAVFALQNEWEVRDARTEPESARDLMTRWNSTHPKWKYARLLLFNRDIKAAVGKVLKRLNYMPLPGSPTAA